jgi:hypothetical protein
MRIVVAVVVGVVLLHAGHVANAAEAKRQRSERCLEICNFTFEQCQKDESSKGNSRCNIDAVRCKNACPFQTIEEPAVPTAMSHQRCVDTCQLTYKKCQGRSENKRGGNCGADEVRCEQACPKPPEPAVVAVPDPNAPPGSPPVVIAPVPTARPKKGLRIEGAAAPAPVSATPVPPPPPVERMVPAARVVPAERAVGGEAPARREAVAPAAAPPAAASEAAAHPAPKQRGFFGTIGCFFVACEPEGSTPCLQQCANAYDECQVRESKRGGECNTRLMNCRKSCSAGALSTP